MTFAEALNEVYVHKAHIKLPTWNKCYWYVDEETNKIMASYTNPKREIEIEEVIPSRIQMYVNREDWIVLDKAC